MAVYNAYPGDMHNALFIYIAFACGIKAQTITSTTLLSANSGQVACANTQATFTCKTIGSSAIVWRSEQFIGTDNTAQLVFFADTHDPGDTRTVSTTVATLTRNELVNGQRVLESTLRVNVPSSSSSQLSVTCVYLDNNVNTTSYFNVLCKL